MLAVGRQTKGNVVIQSDILQTDLISVLVTV